MIIPHALIQSVNGFTAHRKKRDYFRRRRAPARTASGASISGSGDLVGAGVGVCVVGPGVDSVVEIVVGMVVTTVVGTGVAEEVVGAVVLVTVGLKVMLRPGSVTSL